MTSKAKTEYPAARVAVKVPHPDSLVEVRVSPPESNFEVKVSPGQELIELLIRPGASLIEVRITPPGSGAEARLESELSSEDAPTRLVLAGNQNSPKKGGTHGDEEEVVAGVSQSEFAAMVEEEEAAEAKKLLDQMAADSETLPGYELPADVKKILESDEEIDLPEVTIPGPAEDPAEASYLQIEEFEELPDEDRASPAEPQPTLDRPDQPVLQAAGRAAGTALPEIEVAEVNLAQEPAAEVSIVIDDVDEVEMTTETASQMDEESAGDGAETDGAGSLFEPNQAGEPDPAPEVAAEPVNEEIYEPVIVFDEQISSEISVTQPEQPEPGLETDDTLEPPAQGGRPEKIEAPLQLLDMPLPEPDILTLDGQAPLLGQEGPGCDRGLAPEESPLEMESPAAPDETGPPYVEPVSPAAREALARLSAAASEEGASFEEGPEFMRPDSTILVEMYEDSEPGPTPDAVTRTPLSEEEMMDLGPVEEVDEELALGAIDIPDLGDVDLDKSRLADSRPGDSVVKARPLIKVLPANTIVPE